MKRERLCRLLRLFRPSLPLLCLSTGLCAPVLVLLFKWGLEDSAVSYPVYVISLYLVVAWSISLPGAVRRLRAVVYGHRLGHRYLTDLAFRGRLSLVVSTLINTGYALFKLGVGCYYRSVWFGAVAVYYLVLSAARGLLLWNVYRTGGDKAREYRISRLCGCLLFVLTAALAAVAVQMVWDGRGYRYPGFLIFAAALYAFYAVAAAIRNLVRFRRLDSPLLAASKVLSLATALVSMLSLQTAMFASFGGGATFRRRMNAATSAGVCLLILFMAAAIVARAGRGVRSAEAAQGRAHEIDKE